LGVALAHIEHALARAGNEKRAPLTVVVSTGSCARPAAQ
jgi:hypothetical protein